MRLQTAVLIAALSLAAGWSLGGRYGAQSGNASGSAASRGPRPLGVESMAPVAPLTEQLRQRLDRQPPVSRPARNPFVFGRSTPAAAPAHRESAAASAEPPPVADAPGLPAAPGYTLSGIAASKVAEGVAFEYTAILSGSNGLVFARVGDTLADGFEVVDVRETMVMLRDASGDERTLRLP